MTFPSLAAYSTESFTPSADLAGSGDVRTRPGVLAGGVGVVTYLTVLALDTATGAYVPHNPLSVAPGVNKAVGLSGATVDTTAGGQNVPIIVGGDFNVDACTFHVSIETEADKIAVFAPDASIILRHLNYGV